MTHASFRWLLVERVVGTTTRWVTKIASDLFTPKQYLALTLIGNTPSVWKTMPTIGVYVRFPVARKNFSLFGSHGSVTESDGSFTSSR
jgi:hypothetical protein